MSSSSEQAADRLPTYAPLLRAFHQEFAVELRSLVAKLPLSPGQDVLEVAAGDGQFAVWLREQTGPRGTVTAIDISQAWLRTAEQQLKNTGPENQIELIQANATDLPFPDESFDFVWCAQSLYSLPQIQRCLAEMQRVLRPGGHLALLENDSLHHLLLPWPVQLEIQVLAAELKAFRRSASQPARFYAGRWLSRLLRKAGMLRPQERSFAYTRQQPVTAAARLYFQSYLQSLRKRVQPFLSDRALRRLDQLIDPGSRRCLWRQRDFVAVCIDRVVWAER